jgi:hypothetical protein
LQSRSSCPHLAVPFPDLGPDVCTILAADSRPPTSEQSESLTRCRKHDRRVLNALFDARSAIDVCHVAAVSLEALHIFARVFGPQQKHHVNIVQPHDSHISSHHQFQEYLLLHNKAHLAQRVWRRQFLRVFRSRKIDGPRKSPQARRSFRHRSTSTMKLQGMIFKRLIHRRT